MAELYALVKNNTIVFGPDKLPLNYENVSNLPALNDSQLFTLGWYPAYTSNAPSYDNTQFKLDLNWIITGSIVSQSIVVVPLSTQEKIDVQIELTSSFHAYTASAVDEINQRSRDKVNEFMGSNHELFHQREQETREVIWKNDAGQQIKQGFYPTIKSLAEDEGIAFGQYAQNTWDELQTYYTQSSHVETRRRKALKLMKNAKTQADVDLILTNLGY